MFDTFKLLIRFGTDFVQSSNFEILRQMEKMSDEALTSIVSSTSEDKLLQMSLD
jgi:hypothetical protein